MVAIFSSSEVNAAKIWNVIEVPLREWPRRLMGRGFLANRDSYDGGD